MLSHLPPFYTYVTSTSSLSICVCVCVCFRFGPATGPVAALTAAALQFRSNLARQSKKCPRLGVFSNMLATSTLKHKLRCQPKIKKRKKNGKTHFQLSPKPKVLTTPLLPPFSTLPWHVNYSMKIDIYFLCRILNILYSILNLFVLFYIICFLFLFFFYSQFSFIFLFPNYIWILIFTFYIFIDLSYIILFSLDSFYPHFPPITYFYLDWYLLNIFYFILFPFFFNLICFFF